MAYAHPKLMAEIAKKRNDLYSVPNYPTSRRDMKPKQQRFLTEAMYRFQEDVLRNSFHMHGELGAVGDKHGKLVYFTHSPKDSVTFAIEPGDKYVIHSHPPLGKPFDFSASEQDHLVASQTYLDFNNKTKEYLTNGRDVIRILPGSMELIRLHPDPELGKFPVAFTLPVPRQPPYPLQNHEAPATFNGGWLPPAGWAPPEDYPRD
jgi:hypothetical protein